MKGKLAGVLLVSGLCLAACGGNNEVMQIQTVETDAEVVESEVKLVGSYHALLEDEDTKGMIPSLSLYTDNTFGFSFDVLSSYFSHGTYEIKGDKCYMTTEDGKYTYVFDVVDDGFIFLEDESSSVELIDPSFGVQVLDGTFFVDDDKRSDYEVPIDGETSVWEESTEWVNGTDLSGLERLTGTIKEINDSSFLLSSDTDAYPGAFSVDYEDVEGLQSGETVTVYWDGSIKETYPMQIEAQYVETVGD